MRALIIATGYNSHLEPLLERHPDCLLPLVDRPFLQHVVEFLIDQGTTEFDFVLSHLPDRVEDFLGDGARWGSRFFFHLAKDPNRPYRTVRTLDFAGHAGHVLLAHADRLPELPTTKTDSETSAVIFCSGTNEKPQWTGWAILWADALRNLDPDVTEADLESRLMQDAGVKKILVPRVLGWRSFQDLLVSSSVVLNKEFRGLIQGGRETEDRIWISRNVSLHPTASLTAPVFVGQDCQIGRGAKLGPNAVVGANCILDSRCIAVDSIILPGGYVGEALELDHVIVDHNRLVNVKFGAAVTVSDAFILSGITSGSRLGANLRAGLARLSGFILWMLTLPLLILILPIVGLVRSGSLFRERLAVRLPASPNPSSWKEFQIRDLAGIRGVNSLKSHFLLEFLPGLLYVALGRLRLVGVSPRSKEEVGSLPRDWRDLYLHSKVGLVTEALIHFGTRPSQDELYSAEVVYVARSSLKYDLLLLFKYFVALVTPVPRPESKQVVQDG